MLRKNFPETSVKLLCNVLINGECVFPLTNNLNIVYTTKRASQDMKFSSHNSLEQTKNKLALNLKSEEQNL